MKDNYTIVMQRHIYKKKIYKKKKKKKRFQTIHQNDICYRTKCHSHKVFVSFILH